MPGEQHPSHVLYGRIKGRRVGIYIPEELVPEVQRCLDNGRALQELLHRGALRYRQSPEAQSGRKRSKKMTRVADPQISFADMELLPRACSWSRCSKPFPISSTTQRD